jgi:HAD superfamily phosphoserine phosphatase-like hydrolase
MKKLAFFDVDNTIYEGYTGNDFIEFVDSNSVFGKNPQTEMDKILKDYRDRKTDYHITSQLVMDLVASIVSERSVEEVDAVITEMFKSKDKVFAEWFESILPLLSSKGFQFILISGGADFLIKILVEKLESEHDCSIDFFATEIERIDEVYTGNCPQILNDELKSDIVEKVISSLLPNQVETIGFGDSPGDAAMLGKLDKGFIYATKDHEEIIEIAENNNWVVFSKEEELLPIIRDL